MNIKLSTVPTKGIGLPDYSAPKPTGAVPVGTIYTSTDMGELAARLGSIVTFDRRGNVLFLDDFESGFSKWIATGDAGFSAAQSADYARSGGFSAKLVTGPVAGNEIIISKRTPYPTLSSVGFEFSFSHNSEIDITNTIFLYDGTNSYGFEVAYNRASGILVINTGSFERLMSGLFLYQDYTLFHTIKLVVDLETKKYIRLILDNNVFTNLSRCAPNIFASAIAPVLETYTIVTTPIAAPATVYIDDTIVTQNETANA